MADGPLKAQPSGAVNARGENAAGLAEGFEFKAGCWGEEKLDLRAPQHARDALMMRGRRDFESRAHYAAFLSKLFGQLNQGRRERFAEEVKALPLRCLGVCKRLTVRVAPNTTSKSFVNFFHSSPPLLASAK